MHSLQAERTSHGGKMKGQDFRYVGKKGISTDATGAHHQEKISNKPDLIMLVLWSTSG